jgi:uroporphyrinogen decarboxylase
MTPLILSHRAAGAPFSCAVQGNLDPAALLGDEAEIRRAVARMPEAGRGGGQVANLGHGILPMTPVDNARAFVDAVRQVP